MLHCIVIENFFNLVINFNCGNDSACCPADRKKRADYSRFLNFDAPILVRSQAYVFSAEIPKNISILNESLQIFLKESLEKFLDF